MRRVTLTVERESGTHEFTVTDKSNKVMAIVLILNVFSSAIKAFGHELAHLKAAFEVIANALQAADIAVEGGEGTQAKANEQLHEDEVRRDQREAHPPKTGPKEPQH